MRRSSKAGEIGLAEFTERYLISFGIGTDDARPKPGRIGKPRHIFEAGLGFVVWRAGTGNNVELLHIRAFNPGRGDGRRLLHRMLDELVYDPPYYSVFGFAKREKAGFYVACGFDLRCADGVYADGSAVLFVQEYEKLRETQHRFDVLRSSSRRSKGG